MVILRVTEHTIKENEYHTRSELYTNYGIKLDDGQVIEFEIKDTRFLVSSDICLHKLTGAGLLCSPSSEVESQYIHYERSIAFIPMSNIASITTAYIKEV